MINFFLSIIAKLNKSIDAKNINEYRVTAPITLSVGQATKGINVNRKMPIYLL